MVQNMKNKTKLNAYKNNNYRTYDVKYGKLQYTPNSIYFISKSYTYILNIRTNAQLLMRLKSDLCNYSIFIRKL